MKSRSSALGTSIHTGWGAFHMAAEMKRKAAAPWLARIRRKALASARRELAALAAWSLIRRSKS